MQLVDPLDVLVLLLGELGDLEQLLLLQRLRRLGRCVFSLVLYLLGGVRAVQVLDHDLTMFAGDSDGLQASGGGVAERQMLGQAAPGLSDDLATLLRLASEREVRGRVRGGKYRYLLA